MKQLFTFLAATLLFANFAFAQNVGEAAPDFTLKDLSNQNYKLSENKGDVVLVFLVGYNCTLCLQSAPSVKSKLIDVFGNNSKFQTLVIDVWNGSTSAFQGFKNSTGIPAKYLQDGSTVASSWATTKDRLVVIDSEGKIAFKGTRAARSDADDAKKAIQSALNNLTTSVNSLENNGGFALGQNFPNPVTNESKIEFNIGIPSEVTLSVFDITGKKIAVPTQQFYPAGKHEITIQKNNYNRGIYFYRLEADSFSSTKRMIIR